MDIRSFFAKKGPAATAKPAASAAPAAAKPVPAKKGTTPVKSVMKTASPVRRTTPSRQAKRTVVVLDDSEDEDDFEMEEPTPKPVKQRKRVRRALDEEDEEEDDEEIEILPKKAAPAKRQPVKTAPVKTEKAAVKQETAAVKAETAAVKRETAAVKRETAAVKAETTAVKKESAAVKKEEIVDDDMDGEEKEDSTPLKLAQSGRPPPTCSGCLDGKTFVFSGAFVNVKRDELVHLVKSCGGSVGNAVSRNTKYLVIGEKLENGDDISVGSKYRDAVEKNIRMLRQSEFYNLITELAAAKQLDDLQAQKAALKASLNQPPGGTKGKHKMGSSSAGGDALWTDKYKPTSIKDMIGNVELGHKLVQWLMDWDAVHVKQTKKIPFNPKENRGAKTVLLSGPPGIGKTTIATLVAKHCGFECTELNASDTRSKKMLQTGLKDVLGTQAIHFGVAKNSKDRMQLNKRVVIMDEVDGMSGGDRGGTAELIQLIKTSKTPIICICNDRQSQKVRSLANHAFDLRMRRPTKQQISNRLMQIGLAEGLMVEKNAIEEAAERCGNDIRQLITQMQRWRLTNTKITYDDMVNPKSQHNKDESLRLNPFSATQQIFQRDISFEARNEAYFVDYDFMPLMVQENYIQSIMNNKISSDEKLELAAKAADFIAESDVANRYVRQEQRWDLLTTQAAFNVAACVYSQGFIGHPEFSKWLGKNSTASKSKRLLSELSVRMRAHASGSREVIRMDYIPFMKEILLTKLLSGEEHVEEVIELLDSCEISREDLTESMENFKMPGIKRHSYTDLDTKAKTAFTRIYNKASHKSQGVVERELAATTIKKGRGRAVAAPEEGEDGLPPPSDAESEGEGKDDDVDISKFQKKPRGRAAAGGASAAGAAKGKRKAPAGGAAKAAPKKRKA